MNRLLASKRTAVTAALVEGVSINATCRKHVRNLRVRRVQCDEILAFIYVKQENVSAEQMAQGAGDVWTWAAIDADTKLVVSYMLGDRGAGTAKAFMQDVAARITNRLQLTTDGHHVYVDAVEDAFGANIDYAMLQNIYGAPNDAPETRYSPATCIGCKSAVVTGDPDPEHIAAGTS